MTPPDRLMDEEWLTNQETRSAMAEMVDTVTFRKALAEIRRLKKDVKMFAEEAEAWKNKAWELRLRRGNEHRGFTIYKARQKNDFAKTD